MSFAYLIRHGQASASAEDYDQLSPLGFEQSERLRAILQGKSFDRILFGPRRRHRQTLKQAQSPNWPEPERVEWLDEFPAKELMDYGAPILMQREPHLRPIIESFWGQVGVVGEEYAEILQILCDEWITDNISPPEIIRGSQYLNNIQEGMRDLAKDLREQKRVALFTSAGTISCMMGKLLNADIKTSFRSAWSMYNCSITTVRHFRDAPMLVSFNAIEHITPSSRTFI
ncbi:MAG: histidine phosphatase family protein [Myxococcota bacterium]|nr:histidine phosphatase family protein [Myxococcota bacterium]